MRSSTALPTLIFLLLSSLLFGAAEVARAGSKNQQVDRLFSAYSGSKPGASVIIIKDGQIAYEQGYGLLKSGDATVVTGTSNFRLASVSKAFTAMAVLILIDRGELKLDATLEDVFAEFPSYGRGITIRHLLNHTSGLQAYEDLMYQYPTPKPIKDRDILDLMVQRTRSTQFTPGSRYSYSNTGYVLLAQVVERISGRYFSDFLKEEIFDRLGMTQTVAFENGRNEVAERAFGHSYKNGRYVDADQSDTSSTLGDGGIYSSARDMSIWDGYWSEVSAVELISPELKTLALTPGRLNNGAQTSYGFGWSIGAYRGSLSINHTGSTTGFRTAIQRYPERKLTVVVLVNRAESAPWDLAKSVADLYW